MNSFRKGRFTRYDLSHVIAHSAYVMLSHGTDPANYSLANVAVGTEEAIDLIAYITMNNCIEDNRIV